MRNHDKEPKFMMRYDDLFNEHMEMARKKIREKNKREPNTYELIDEYSKLMEYFYDDVNASFLILLALASPYFSFNFFI